MEGPYWLRRVDATTYLEARNYLELAEGYSLHSYRSCWASGLCR